jgi:hypothetical protein
VVERSREDEFVRPCDVWEWECEVWEWECELVRERDGWE